MSFSAPHLLTAEHDLTAFDCGQDSLNIWLKQHALSNQIKRASRTFVIAEAAVVKGYYSLSAGSVAHADATGKIRRNMPDPVPMALLGRLAVDRSVQGTGAGRGMLKDAVLRVLQAAEHLAVRGILVDAIDAPAKEFYERFGFRPAPSLPMKLTIAIEEAERALRAVR